MSAFEDARGFEFKRFEETLFEEVIVFFGVRNQYASLKDCGRGFLEQEFPVFENGGREDRFHCLLGVNKRDGEKREVQEDERILFLELFCGAKF